MGTLAFSDLLKHKAAIVDAAMSRWLPKCNLAENGKLYEACRYSALGGGKRIRAILCLLVGECFGNCSDAHLLLGSALELIHAYSLIHDDLPAMDNDDFRRGKPTNHKIYGEAMAILAGDNLLTLAFEWLARLHEYKVPAENVVAIISLVAKAAGGEGMIGGQALDLAGENKTLTISELEKIHRKKTGALIYAPIACAAILSNASKKEQEILARYSGCIGLLFQIVDDILDVEGSFENLGKTPGSDARLGKSTYPALLGMDGAKKLAAQKHEEARKVLEGLNRNYSLLAEMADFIYSRKN
ncbi:MAG: polyprenyl synthetase family protein [Candidatus Rifleibacteriota bacterium]